MDEAGQFLSAWKVQSIEILLGGKGAQVTFRTDGRAPIRFRTSRFGIGKRGAKSAALAKFASQAGFGEASFLYRHVCALPPDLTGPVFWDEMPALVASRKAPRALRCHWPDADVA